VAFCNFDFNIGASSGFGNNPAFSYFTFSKCRGCCKKNLGFPAAFLTGAVLDILLLNPLGKTSLFLVVFLFIILLYDKKFDIQTFPFVFLASFIGSFVYFIAFQISKCICSSFN